MSSRWNSWVISELMHWILFMEFYFCCQYILMVMTRKLNGICRRLSRIFGVLMIIMSIRSEKIILKISLVISPWHLYRSAAMPKWGWLGKLISGGTTTIDHVDIGLSYKIFFILGMFHTFFIHLRLIAKRLMLSMSPSSRDHHSAI